MNASFPDVPVRSLLGLLAASLALAACGNDPARPDTDARYEVEVSGETFLVEVADATARAALDARLASGAEGVINGELLAGDGGYNEPWSWHLDPSTVEAPDLAIEVCDGRPSMVEADLDYWIGTVGRFCPWGATVVARVE